MPAGFIKSHAVVLPLSHLDPRGSFCAIVSFVGMVPGTLLVVSFFNTASIGQ